MNGIKKNKNVRLVVICIALVMLIAIIATVVVISTKSKSDKDPKKVEKSPEKIGTKKVIKAAVPLDKTPVGEEKAKTPVKKEDVELSVEKEDVKTPVITEEVKTPVITEEVKKPVKKEEAKTPVEKEEAKTLEKTPVTGFTPITGVFEDPNGPITEEGEQSDPEKGTSPDKKGIETPEKKVEPKAEDGTPENPQVKPPVQDKEDKEDSEKEDSEKEDSEKEEEKEDSEKEEEKEDSEKEEEKDSEKEEEKDSEKEEDKGEPSGQPEPKPSGGLPEDPKLPVQDLKKPEKTPEKKETPDPSKQPEPSDLPEKKETPKPPVVDPIPSGQVPEKKDPTKEEPLDSDVLLGKKPKSFFVDPSKVEVLPDKIVRDPVYEKESTIAQRAEMVEEQRAKPGKAPQVYPVSGDLTPEIIDGAQFYKNTAGSLMIKSGNTKITGLDPVTNAIIQGIISCPGFLKLLTTPKEKLKLNSEAYNNGVLPLINFLRHFTDKNDKIPEKIAQVVSDCIKTENPAVKSVMQLIADTLFQQNCAGLFQELTSFENIYHYVCKECKHTFSSNDTNISCMLELFYDNTEAQMDPSDNSAYKYTDCCRLPQCPKCAAFSTEPTYKKITKLGDILLIRPINIPCNDYTEILEIPENLNINGFNYRLVCAFIGTRVPDNCLKRDWHCVAKRADGWFKYKGDDVQKVEAPLESSTYGLLMYDRT